MSNVLFRISPALNTLTDALTVPAGPRRVLSTVKVANMSGGDITVDIAISPGGVADAPTHHLAPRVIKLTDGDQAPSIPIWQTIAPTDKVRVKTTGAAAFTGYE